MKSRLIAKEVALWGKKHVWQSWMLITVLHFLMIFLATILAKILYFNGIELRLIYLMPLFGIAAIGFLFYPIKRNEKGWWKSTFEQRKNFDKVLILVGIAMTLILSNSLTQETTLRPPIEKIIQVDVARPVNFIPNIVEKNTTQEKRFSIKRWLSKKNYKSTKRFKRFWKKKDTLSRVILTLTILGVMFLAFILVVNLSCSLSCSGAVVLGNVVFFLGIIGILIVGGVLLFRIFKPKQKKILENNSIE